MSASRRIVVIDDHPDGAAMLREILQLFGHRVEIARTGEAGLDKIHAFRPDIVFCDWRLPGMDGGQVVTAVRSDRDLAGTYMVSLTAHCDEEIRQSALRSGFDVHLVKPPEVDRLEQLVQDCKP